jgi:cystathionine beta-lyase family protein involved in aluminum resistance
VNYREIPLTAEGLPDYQKIMTAVTEKTRVVFIQRSRGYTWRKSLCVQEIGKLVKFVKNIKAKVICFVDNCYGEFVEEREPTHVGADLAAGSLIKNPGGGLAPTGGYLVGKKELVARTADWLIAPGLGNKIGTNLGLGHLFYQGFFMAPQIVGEALKGAIFAAHFFTSLGFEASPPPGSPRSDLVQALKLNLPEGVKAFCRGIQSASPIDSHAVPESSFLPGYQDPVIMAAGTFVQGASLELSADAPLRPPYIVYVQGGLSYAHSLLGLLSGAQELVNQGLVSGFAEKVRA